MTAPACSTVTQGYCCWVYGHERRGRVSKLLQEAVPSSGDRRGGGGGGGLADPGARTQTDANDVVSRSRVVGSMVRSAFHAKKLFTECRLCLLNKK